MCRISSINSISHIHHSLGGSFSKKKKGDKFLKKTVVFFDDAKICWATCLQHFFDTNMNQPTILLTFVSPRFYAPCGLFFRRGSFPNRRFFQGSVPVPHAPRATAHLSGFASSTVLSLRHQIPQHYLSYEKTPCYFPLYWLVNRDPYNGLL